MEFRFLDAEILAASNTLDITRSVALPTTCSVILGLGSTNTWYTVMDCCISTSFCTSFFIDLPHSNAALHQRSPSSACLLVTLLAKSISTLIYL